jgi:hypothetical protein
MAALDRIPQVSDAAQCREVHDHYDGNPAHGAADEFFVRGAVSTTSAGARAHCFDANSRTRASAAVLLDR